jgi:endogenous inhibitor of DNA gyrase (YacG/DUF329 family)
MSDYSTEVADIFCPYCGESIEVVIDMSVESQEYIEDCSVCCRPITLTAWVADGAVQVNARHEND